MTIADSSGNAFVTWCHFHGRDTTDPTAFDAYMMDTTGWDGRQFSLTEDERHWIRRANEVVEWLRLYMVAEDQRFLDSAMRSLAGMRPMPGSLKIE